MHPVAHPVDALHVVIIIPWLLEELVKRLGIITDAVKLLPCGLLNTKPEARRRFGWPSYFLFLACKWRPLD